MADYLAGYPSRICDALVINRIDVLSYLDFDMEKMAEYAHMIIIYFLIF